MFYIAQSSAQVTHQPLTLEAGPNPRLNLSGRGFDRQCSRSCASSLLSLPASTYAPIRSATKTTPIMIMAAPDARLTARAAKGRARSTVREPTPTPV